MEKCAPSMSHTMPSALKPMTYNIVKRAATFNFPQRKEKSLSAAPTGYFVALSPSRTFTKKTPTLEVKKAQPLPPPDHKPPPPLDRPSAYQNQRPLPPTPESSKLKEQNNAGSRRGSRSTAVTQMPWYHNIDRKGADELLRNSVDGTFILRPSSQAQNPLSLTLWFNSRMYNISVRHRPDGKYALGYEKPNEQSFTSIEELVVNYQSENLVLYSNGERTGRTLLTGWPPRRD